MNASNTLPNLTVEGLMALTNELRGAKTNLENVIKTMPSLLRDDGKNDRVVEKTMFKYGGMVIEVEYGAIGLTSKTEVIGEFPNPLGSGIELNTLMATKSVATRLKKHPGVAALYFIKLTTPPFSLNGQAYRIAVSVFGATILDLKEVLMQAINKVKLAHGATLIEPNTKHQNKTSVNDSKIVSSLVVTLNPDKSASWVFQTPLGESFTSFQDTLPKTFNNAEEIATLFMDDLKKVLLAFSKDFTPRKIYLTLNLKVSIFVSGLGEVARLQRISEDSMEVIPVYQMKPMSQLIKNDMLYQFQSNDGMPPEVIFNSNVIEDTDATLEYLKYCSA